MRRDWLKSYFVWCTFALLLVTAMWFPMQDSDAFFYISLGRFFFENGHFPDSDIYLYTFQNWHIYHEWLTYLLFYSFVWIGGLTGLTVLKVCLWLLIFFLLLETARRWKIHESLIFVILFLTALICSHRFIDRASVFSDLFLTFLLSLFLNREPLSKRSLWLIPLIFALWVNLHPAFILGLALYSMYAVLQGRQISKRLIGSVIGSYLACLMNPEFLKGAAYPFLTALKPQWEAHRKINFEWMPTFLKQFLGAWEVQSLILLFSVTFLIVAYLAFKKPRQSLFVLGAFCLYAYLAQNAMRFMPTAALGFSLLLFHSIRELNWRVPEKIGFPARITLSAAFLSLAGWIFFNGYPSAAGHRNWGSGVDPIAFPAQAVQFMQQNQINHHLFNQYEWGPYLIWELNPSRGLFISTHVDDPTFLSKEYYGMSAAKEHFDQTVAHYDIRFFVLDQIILGMNPRPVLLEFLSSWKVIYQDKTAVIWARP